MPDEIEVICPECWNDTFIDIDDDDEMITCPECNHQFYSEEGVQ